LQYGKGTFLIRHHLLHASNSNMQRWAGHTQGNVPFVLDNDDTTTTGDDRVCPSNTRVHINEKLVDNIPNRSRKPHRIIIRNIGSGFL
tara:strand:- start:1336 stop:1599 length:264 start_codon:yes stop_codon:yes gene_type:complete